MTTVDEFKKRNQYVLMKEEEAWKFLGAREQQIASLTTVNKKGWPVTVPIIFLADDKKIYFNAFKWRGDVLHKKVRDIANNPIVNIMSEAGFVGAPLRADGWPDHLRTGPGLRFVSVVGTAKVIADPAPGNMRYIGDVAHVDGIWNKFKEKYGRSGLPSSYIGLPKEQEHIYFEVTPIRIYSQAGYVFDDRMLPRLEEEVKTINEPK